MANGLYRKITMGIATETGSYGNGMASPTYSIPNVELQVEEVTDKVENNAMFGSSYAVNDSMMSMQHTNFNMKMKVDENLLPLLLKQKFSISSAAVGGDTLVYTHTLSYNTTNAGSDYTLFFQDPDRTSMKITGCKFDKIDIEATQDNFVLLTVSGKGKYPTTWTGSNTMVAPREFVGRNVAFRFATATGALASTKVLDLKLSHAFPLSDDKVNVSLGSSTYDGLYTLADRFESEVTLLMPDTTIKGYYDNYTKVQSDVTITDTGRIIVGSTTNLNPSIIFTYPIQEILKWNREGGLDELVQQKVSLLALNKTGTSDAPMKVVIKNNVASY